MKLSKLICLIFIITHLFLIMNSNTGINVITDDFSEIKSAKKLWKSVTNSSIEFSNLFGGNSDDFGKAVAVDINNDIIITGHTFSSDFPILNALQLTNRGYKDCFFSNYSSSGLLISSTYIGGSEDESSEDLAIDKDGNIIIIGDTESETDFPATNKEYLSNSSTYSCFLIKITTASNEISSLSSNGLTTPSFDIWNLVFSILVISSIFSFKRKRS